MSNTKIKKFWVFNIILLVVFFVVNFCLIDEARAEDERTYYQGIIVDQSYSGIVYLERGKGMTFWIKYKNIGYYRWRDKGERMVSLKVNDETDATKKFEHEFWNSEDVVGVLPKRTEVGEYATWRFALQAPDEAGEYVLKFKMWAYGDWFKGEDIQIKIRVGWAEYLEKLRAEQVEVLGVESNKKDGVYVVGDMAYPEPDIRVGLYSMDEEDGKQVQISSTGSYGIYGTHGQLYARQTDGEMSELEFDYANKRYFINVSGKRMVSGDRPFVFKQGDENNIFTIVNYSNPAYAGSETNYNQFRGSLEAQWIEDNERLWVINEVSMEDYVKGSGESMDISPYEFLKAMAVAERTYAMFNYLSPTKHKVRNFTVTASQSDQIYQGYGREKIQPNIVRATEDSRGLIVTYDGAVALTPYYSQSDGRTRSYEEVWHRTSYPYLVSVSDPHMAGKRQIGHGVGMSARGALFTASRDGKNFEELLYHYYTGVEIKKIY